MPRKEYQLTSQELEEMLEACKPVPAMMIGNIPPTSQQESANRAWNTLGKRRGFRGETAQPVSGKSDHFFTAVPIGESE